MANRDHSLDDGIIQAAYSEFLAYGFQKASLHKIAEKAGVTTGAIYTRYKNKDALFASLLQDFFETMQVLFAPIAEEYEKAKCSAHAWLAAEKASHALEKFCSAFWHQAPSICYKYKLVSSLLSRHFDPPVD